LAELENYILFLLSTFVGTLTLKKHPPLFQFKLFKMRFVVLLATVGIAAAATTTTAATGSSTTSGACAAQEYVAIYYL
jgi:hypothetical protein